MELAKSATLTYGISRRRLGICYVGTIVMFALFALLSGFYVHQFGTTDKTSIEWFRNILFFTFSLEILSLPFDLVGFQIERTYGKTTQSLPHYLSIWCRASFKHATLFLACAFVFTSAAHCGGIAAVALSSLALSVFLIWKQAEIARFISEIQFEEPSQEIRAKYLQNRSGETEIVIARTKQIGFTGGIVGLPKGTSIVIPERWLDTLSERELWAEITRRNVAISSGSRTRGVRDAGLFTVVGVLLATLSTTFGLGLSLETSAGAVSSSLFFTLWSFVGLLLLPSYNQKAVMEIDRKAVEKGVSRELLEQTIKEIDKSMENEQERTDSVQFVFHPIPTPGRRTQALTGSGSNDATGDGAWNVARYSIWLSLVGMGLLSRAVHCNAGKPELWCMLPAD